MSRHRVWATDISLKSDVCVFGFFVCDFLKFKVQAFNIFVTKNIFMFMIFF